MNAAIGIFELCALLGVLVWMGWDGLGRRSASEAVNTYRDAVAAEAQAERDRAQSVKHAIRALKRLAGRLDGGAK
ncbi:hypothetical protein A7R75_10435 [Mycolicibacterium llatzerense]|nr:hypothetical protein [Mycolicibacterium llatzerense]